MNVEIEIKDKKLLFGYAANYDYIQDATGEDPLLWSQEKAGMFIKVEGEESKWEYKGNRDLVVVALYSGINNWARANKGKRITMEEAKDFLYDLNFDERNSVVNAFFTGIIEATKVNGQGESKAQTKAAD